MPRQTPGKAPPQSPIEKLLHHPHSKEHGIENQHINFILQFLETSRPLSLWKAVMAPKFCFGISGFSPQAGARMSWGSADLVPTSRPLRSEQALGSVVPSPIFLPALPSH